MLGHAAIRLQQLLLCHGGVRGSGKPGSGCSEIAPHPGLGGIPAPLRQFCIWVRSRKEQGVCWGNWKLNRPSAQLLPQDLGHSLLPTIPSLLKLAGWLRTENKVTEPISSPGNLWASPKMLQGPHTGTSFWDCPNSCLNLSGL